MDPAIATIIAAGIAALSTIAVAVIQRKRASGDHRVEPGVPSRLAPDSAPKSPSRSPRTPEGDTSGAPGGADVETALRRVPDIQRLLTHQNWRPAAEAAIAFFAHGTPSPVDEWPRSRAWQQVGAVFERLDKPGRKRNAA